MKTLEEIIAAARDIAAGTPGLTGYPGIEITDTGLIHYTADDANGDTTAQITTSTEQDPWGYPHMILTLHGSKYAPEGLTTTTTKIRPDHHGQKYLTNCLTHAIGTVYTQNKPTFTGINITPPAAH